VTTADLMPNIQIDYTANLDDVVARADLVRALRGATVATEVFPTWGIRVFAVPIAACAVADGAADNGFIQVMVRIAPGRDVATRQRVAAALFDAMSSALAPFQAGRRFGWQLEICEFDSRFTLSRTNLVEDA
jgi:5-carboxymethyl-2-hydroxymuconate isomerase